MLTREKTEKAPLSAAGAAPRPDVSVLLEAFQHFEENAKKLEAAYKKMQEDFRSLNIELDVKNNLLSQILQNLTNSVVAVDTDGKITSFNRGAERLTGLKSAQAVGRVYAEVLGRGVETEKSLMHTLRSGKYISEQEKNILHADGHPVPVSFTTCLLEDSQGHLLGALEVLRDLSEVRAMQEEVQRSKTLAALGEMAAAVAHEIRNPLGAIGVGISVLEREVANDPAKDDVVKKIISSLGSLNRIVGNLLVYTRPLSLQLREVNLQEHVAQVLDFILIGVTREDVEIVREFPGEPLSACIDPEKTEQVLINLVQNAIQAIEGPGKVTVSIGLREKSPDGPARILLNGLRADRVVDIKVRDTGKGIREENLDKIFNPFFTTRTDGNGLGLSIVRKIVELHNGEITVKSSPGQGAEFTMSLPG